MLAYLVRRLLLFVPTLFGIMIVNFIVVQAAPGGPVDLMISRLRGHAVEATARVGGSGGGETRGGPSGPTGATGDITQKYRGARGIDPELIRQLERQYGFDRPAPERFVRMIRSYLVFDFGSSFYRDRRVIDLIVEKLPVSISLGLWTTLLVYLVSIPLGIGKAVRDGSRFDLSTSSTLVVLNAIPGFLFALLLVVLFAGGGYFKWFPLRGLVSDDWSSLGPIDKVLDYFWHMALPIGAMVIGGFATLTFLTKNSFLEEIHKQYVLTAKAKGLHERRVLYGHVFRNAMLIVIAGFPAAFIGVLFTGSLLIEVIFSLDGLGLLGFEATINRDYPVILGSLFIFSLLGLAANLLGDITYTLVDPRIDFERRDV